jgi:hypothetical protein
MASFQFIETFFFLSLGITFGLVLLLVYHFKQRITSLEQKCDTMFDIVQNVVKELGVAKANINYMLTNQMQSQSNFATLPSMFMPNMNTVSNNYIDEMNLQEEHDDEDDEDDEDEDEDEDDEDEDEDEDDEDDEDDEHDEREPNVFEKIRIDDNLNDSVKQIDIEDIPPLDISNLENTDLEHNEKDLDFEELSESVELTNIEPIVVNKLENVNEEPIVENNKSVVSPEIYKRMGLTDLKKLVISKGLYSDPSKLKKQELIKMLIDGEQ